VSINLQGIINLGEREDYIRELTMNRPLATIPFAGRYRLIDFTLSNMVNSGIDSISLIVKNKFHSLNDHIGPGKDWDLDRKTGGLRILYPDMQPDLNLISVGDIPVVRSNLSHFSSIKKDYILLTRSNYIGNINYRPAFEEHVKKGSDITILTRHIRNGRARVELLGMDIVQKRNNSYTIGRNLGNQNDFDLSIEMFIMKKSVFLRIIHDAIEEGAEAFLKKAIISRLGEYKVSTYTIEDDILPIHSIQQYYNASLAILDPAYAEYLFYKHGKIYTKAKDAPSTLYAAGSEVNHSLIANGCVIEGTVENSIIFRDVHIGRGAVVRNSIVFQDTDISTGANLNYCIVDKFVHVGKGKVLMGDGGLPYVIKKGVSIR